MPRRGLEAAGKASDILSLSEEFQVIGLEGFRDERLREGKDWL